MVVERLDERSYEIETADGSTYRLHRIHLRKTNEPPLGKLSVNHFGPQSPWGSTLTELPQVSSYSNNPDEHTPCENSLARDPPHSEPYEETQESAAEVRTRSGRLVTRSSYLKDFVAR